MTTSYPISPSRAKRQAGNEIVEFALWAVFVGPLLLWMFVNGMNMIRMTQAVQINRDVGNLYIHGQDFSQYSAQKLAQRLATGYGLQIGSSFSGNKQNNDNNSGNGYVVLSLVEYLGANACSGVANCSQGHYVFLQRIAFGNKSLQIKGATVASSLGNPTANLLDSYGNLATYLTDQGAWADNMANIVSTPFTDQQTAYVSETWFASPDLDFAAYPGGGLYSRTMF